MFLAHARLSANMLHLKLKFQNFRHRFFLSFYQQLRGSLTIKITVVFTWWFWNQ